LFSLLPGADNDGALPERTAHAFSTKKSLTHKRGIHTKRGNSRQVENTDKKGFFHPFLRKSTPLKNGVAAL
jgi:hypothetical protein